MDCFNSKLVRLKDLLTHQPRTYRKRFNSKLVRLKAMSVFRGVPCVIRVSIPNWCD